LHLSKNDGGMLAFVSVITTWSLPPEVDGLRSQPVRVGLLKTGQL
jgi:hypothetical protein